MKSTETDDATIPPGSGLSTETLANPGSARSAVVRSVVTAVGLTDVGCRKVPFHRMIDPATKFVPFTVRVKGPLVPAFALDGLREIFIGAPLWRALILNDAPAEVPPPGGGFVTEISATEGFVTSAASTVMVK
jgi:hypothetical protein